SLSRRRTVMVLALYPCSFKPCAEAPQAAAHPPLFAHRVACYFISKQPFQGRDDPRVLHLGQFASGTRATNPLAFLRASLPIGRTGFQLCNALADRAI